MKLKLLALISSIALCSTVYAQDEPTISPNPNQLAIQAAMATGGTLGMGLTYYTPSTEVGFTLSGKVNNASSQTSIIVPVLFGGFRKPLRENTDFAYGLDFVSVFGKDHGQTINADYQLGPYISLEQKLTQHVLLVGWIEPYAYQYEKKGGHITSTHHFFDTGGIGLSYLLG